MSEQAASVIKARLRADRVGGLVFFNAYTETAPAEGGEFVREEEIIWRGETREGDINANQVNHYYDDPRLSYT